MTADLQRLLNHVQQRHGSAVDWARGRHTPDIVDKTIADAASLGYIRWPQAGLALASTNDLPIAAFQHVGSVHDEQEFRKGMLDSWGLNCIAQRDVLPEATKSALAVSEGDSLQWFLEKGSKPGASPPAAAHAPDPPTARPTDATPQQSQPAAPVLGLTSRGPPAMRDMAVRRVPGWCPFLASAIYEPKDVCRSQCPVSDTCLPDPPRPATWIRVRGHTGGRVPECLLGLPPEISNRLPLLIALMILFVCASACSCCFLM